MAIKNYAWHRGTVKQLVNHTKENIKRKRRKYGLMRMTNLRTRNIVKAMHISNAFR